MTTTELINLINTISLRDKKNSIEQGRIMRVNPDNTYNVLITGSSGQLYKIPPVNDSNNSYSVGDNVLVGYAFESSAIPNILGRSSLEIPEEEEVVVKEKYIENSIVTTGNSYPKFKTYTLSGENEEIIINNKNPLQGGAYSIGVGYIDFYFIYDKIYVYRKYPTEDISFLRSFVEIGTGDDKFIGSCADIGYLNEYLYAINSHKIKVFDTLGNFQFAFGGLGSGDGQLNNPKGIDFDSSGNIYIDDNGNKRISKFSSDGIFITNYGVGVITSSSSGITIDSQGNIYIICDSTKKILKFNSSGTYVTEWGTGLTVAQQTKKLQSDNLNNIYFLTNISTSKIYKFDSSGTEVADWIVGDNLEMLSFCLVK